MTWFTPYAARGLGLALALAVALVVFWEHLTIARRFALENQRLGHSPAVTQPHKPARTAPVFASHAQVEDSRLSRTNADVVDNSGSERAGTDSGTTSWRPRLAVHCFAFDRPEHFERLWSSLHRAQPAQTLDVHFVLHVDFDPLNSTEWLQTVATAHALSGTRTKHGPVATIFATGSHGLRATMLEAWTPMDGEFAMFLEDDIEVSELIFTFAERFIATYGLASNPDPSVMGYKLYNQKWDEVNQRYERPILNNFAPFKIQEPCSWGTVFAPGPYRQYLKWYLHNQNKDPYVPNAWSNTWDAQRSAKKFLQRYMWEESLVLIAINLPEHLSLTTPRIDAAGTNIKVQWLGYLRERLEVPLITARDLKRLKARHFDPFALPPANKLLILNLTHDQVPELSQPKPAMLRILDGDQLPPREVLDPIHYRGARFRILDRALTKVRAMLINPRLPQPTHQSLSPAEGAALQIILSAPVEKDGGGLGQDYVRRITDRGILFTLAKMFMPSAQRLAFVLDTQYGLTNRLRAYGSAKAIADGSGRFLVVLWELDAHCQAPMNDLFEQPVGIHVLVNGEPLRELLRKTHLSGHFQQFDLMDPAQKTRNVDGRITSHIYVRSAFQINSKMGYGIANVLAMRELIQQPAPPVQRVLDTYYATLPKTPSGAAGPAAQRRMVGAHIRMVHSVARDTPGLSGGEALRMELATAFRVSCHYRYFREMMQTFPQSTTFFISADSPAAYRAFKEDKEFASRVFYSDSNECTERTARCMQFAAADLILLTQTSKLLTSKWSAFSETAGRISGVPTINACDEPEGGWKLNLPSELSKQIIDYLQSHNFRNVSRVQAALAQFLHQPASKP
ncbi:uncharacterized protein MONBRDRAFT_29316 [Monosiga brevicollis MX1]|uniref:Uncharacterized protein n=1 Tax=Monosiga brevicollis TaxID=81824 RepID=A9VAR4_MONBE|nr:uncharacterized protein MONBRDRAFT_29316 [Monosiga brevicollis MX1]EDQ85420.1 predicted protein [Monosiga brevicollis MX1]|eukprot:XP_001749831.1 hypothetical protein [Monosiga brevicollis MX1]